MFGFVCAAVGSLAIVGSVVFLVSSHRQRQREIDNMPEGDPLPACSANGDLVCPYIFSERECEGCEYWIAEKMDESAKKLCEAIKMSSLDFDTVAKEIREFGDVAKETLEVIYEK